MPFFFIDLSYLNTSVLFNIVACPTILEILSNMTLDSIPLDPDEKVYFASDFHLGMPSHMVSLERERLIVQWLDTIATDAKVIFLVGDLFDFWFEYRHVIPKGCVRFLGKLAQLSDAGVKIVVFSGNHDVWYHDYFQEELNIKVIHEPVTCDIGGKSFYIAHGDGLAKKWSKTKLLKPIFRNKLCIALYKWLHPDIGISLARLWSRYSRADESSADQEEQGLIQHSLMVEKAQHHDFYIYGDCHKAGYEAVTNQATYVNLGEWITQANYAVFNGRELELKSFNV